MKRAFTLIELLVVVGIIALLTGIMVPATSSARLRAKIAVVNAELRDIAMALESYSYDNDDLYPPTRVDCAAGDHFYQLPVELVECKYLPSAGKDTYMSAGVEDRFNRGYTYKYRSVGTLIYNRTLTIENGSSLWIPDGFPHCDKKNEDGEYYSSPETSPVSWVLYSQGPNFDLSGMKKLQYPVPKQTWYDHSKGSGVIVRMRLKDGNQTGTFEN
jgi:prepilin-type N-terminal cleavage/methylation domain-containing protein